MNEDSLQASYQYDEVRNKALIVIGRKPFDPDMTMTVSEAASLIESLTRAIAFAFYDFTASTPNNGSSAQGD